MGDFYIARNHDGWLCLFFKKPTRNLDTLEWTSSLGGHCVGVIETKHDLFPEISWKDNPVRVELVAKSAPSEKL